MVISCVYVVKCSSRYLYLLRSDIDMKKQLQGITLILFGILLSASGYSLNDTLFSNFSDLPFGFLGVIIGIVGLVFVFKEASDKNS